MDKEPGHLRKMIYESVNIKRIVVEEDPFENGERAKLNFGHTLGHAIEKYYDFRLTHGECVALGSIAAAYISYKRGDLSAEEFYEIRDIFVPFGLPISFEDQGPDIKRIIALTVSDKKNDEKGLKFILLNKTGSSVITRDVTAEEMEEALSELIIDEEE